MTRQLVFDGEKGARRFELCLEALIGAGDKKGPRDRATIRKEARLLEAFDGISLPDPTQATSCVACQRPANPEARVLHLNGSSTQVLHVSQEDFTLLQQYVDTAPWLPKAARAAVDLQDWLTTAPTIEG